MPDMGIGKSELCLPQTIEKSTSTNGQHTWGRKTTTTWPGETEEEEEEQGDDVDNDDDDNDDDVAGPLKSQRQIAAKSKAARKTQTRRGEGEKTWRQITANITAATTTTTTTASKSLDCTSTGSGCWRRLPPFCKRKVHIII